MTIGLPIPRDSTIALTLNVGDAGGPVSGLAPTVAIRDALHATRYLDFDDLTFKTSGWTAKAANMVEADAGVYLVAGGIDLTTIGNLAAIDGDVLSVEYEAELDGITHKDVDLVALERLSIDLEEITVRALHRRELDFAAQQVVFYKADGVTEHARHDVETENGEPVATQFGVQTKISGPV